MKQVVDLYDPRFRPRRVSWPARRVFPALLAAAVLFALLAGLQGWRAGRAEAAAAVAQAARDRLQAEVDALRPRVENRRPDPALERALADTERALAARKRVLDWVAAAGAPAAAPFSELLAGPARRPVRGLWLTQLWIEDGGAALLLAGRTHDPALLVRWLNGLGEEPAYDGRRFRRVSMDSEAAEGPLDFVLATLGEPVAAGRPGAGRR
ncbi:MAG: hypothetical protein KatS3mg121_1062 [Gammaproteobacteria bacterium]|nr:MAG: hypothetical protein KatS3mg121_1062 [Gammaproteobacteria bacterium]